MKRKVALLVFLVGSFFALPTAVRADGPNNCGEAQIDCYIIAQAICSGQAADYCCCSGTCGWDCAGAGTDNCGFLCIE